MSENQHDDRDARVAQHEAAHLCVGRALGATFGGATIEENPELGFSGLCWGPNFESRFAGDTNSSVIEQIDALMPVDGGTRSDVMEIYQHVHTRIIELTAGSEGEKLAFGDAWTAADDRAQERKLASLIYSSPEAAEAFIAACALEARAILRRHADVVDALVAALVLHRTLDTAMIDSTISGAVAARHLVQEHERRRRWKDVVARAGSFNADECRD
jgi:hypothetical protein